MPTPLYCRSDLNITQNLKQHYASSCHTSQSIRLTDPLPLHTPSNEGPLLRHATPDAGGVIPLMRSWLVAIAFPI